MMNHSVTGVARGGSRRGHATAAIAGIVVVWWLLLAGAVVVVLPRQAESASKAGAPFAVGSSARIHQSGLASWPIPVDREAYDEAQRGFRESDEAAIDHAFAAFEWIQVSHHQTVRIVAVDGDAIQVEIVDGPRAGRRAWLAARNLAP